MRVKTMIAAILAQSRAPLVVDEVELPKTLRPGQILARVLFSGICGSQLGEIDAVKGEDAHLPHLLGHEAAAEVVECGPGARHALPGDLAVLHWRPGLGIEAEPPVYSWRGRKLNAGRIATFGQYAVVSENRLTVVPPDSPRRLLPLLGCAVTTGLGVAANDARIRPGESAVVFGAGGVGLSVIQGAALAGAHPIIAVDLFDNRLDLSLRLGATHAVNAGREDAPAAARAILAELGHGRGADVCVENTGNAAAIAAAWELADPRGRVVLVGVPRKGEKAAIDTLPLHFGKSITGSHGGGAVPQDDIPRCLGLMRAGKLKLEGLVSEIRPLAEVNAAIDGMRSGITSGRCLIDCG